MIRFLIIIIFFLVYIEYLIDLSVLFLNINEYRKIIKYLGKFLIWKIEIIKNKMVKKKKGDDRDNVRSRRKFKIIFYN